MKNARFSNKIVVFIAAMLTLSFSFGVCVFARTYGHSITINYNVLKKYNNFPLENDWTGGTLARLYHPGYPYGYWKSSHATGEITITNHSPDLLHPLCFPSCDCYNDLPCTYTCTCGYDGYQLVKFSSYPGYTLVNTTPLVRHIKISTTNNTLNMGSINSITITTNVRRSDFAGVAAGEPAYRVGTVTAKWTEVFNRPYYVYCYRTNEATGETYTDGYTPSPAKLTGLEDVTMEVTVYCYTYDGRAIASPSFFNNGIDNNTDTSFDRAMRWTSTPMQFMAVRYMYYESGGGSLYNQTQFDTHRRDFVAQNSANLRWGVNLSQEAGYQNDRTTATERNYTTDENQKAVFASDRDSRIQDNDYPIRSGYFFNPTGQYTVTVTTSLYKKTGAETSEHQELVNAVISSFRYESNMVYQDSTGKAVYIDGSEANKPGSVYIAKTTTVGAGTNPLTGTDIDVTLYSEPAIIERLSHRIPSIPEDTANYNIEPNCVDDLFKAVLEGYEASGSRDSRINKRYTEYVHPDENVFRITETTTITVTVNSGNEKLYTHPQMANGEYSVRAYYDPIILSSLNTEQLMRLRDTGYQINGALPDEGIKITVVGSAFDDAR